MLADPIAQFFLVCLALCVGVVYKTWQTGSTTGANDRFTGFQRNYIAIWLCMMMADWLQGPYVYALYSAYGYSKEEIGMLFIVGFGSSMILGTFAGSLADRCGRKTSCIAFGLIYGFSCLTKHSPNFQILMVGRLTGGIATSLLFSVFEAWMVKEHFTNGHSGELLSSTFTRAYFGNSIVAILAGLIGGYAADSYGPVAPFDCSLVMLIIGTIGVFVSWTENYGDAETENSSAGIGDGIKALLADPKLLLCGTVQSLFEGSMYTFVFMWTPALEEAGLAVGMKKIPHGLIFAIFMVCCMIGSMLVKEFESRNITPSVYMTYMLPVAALSILPGVLNLGFWQQLTGFAVFEGCVGIYFPTWGTLRGGIIPENLRATIMNLYRVPLNLIVVLVLMNIGGMNSSSVFKLCFLFLVLSSGAMYMLVQYLPQPKEVSDALDIEAADAEFDDSNQVDKPLLEQVLQEAGLLDEKDVEV